MINFNNMRVYITGGSSGIGLELARQLYASGAHILLFARNRKKLDAACAEVKKRRYLINPNQKIEGIALDVSDHAAVKKTMERAVDAFGAPDLLVNSAGLGHADYFENISYDTFDSIIQTNLYGTRNVIAALLPGLKENKGRIVIISSIAGILGMFGYTAYGTSKFALVGFADCLRSELKPHGVRVSLACPPETDTPLIREESKTIPPAARALKNLAGLLTPEHVAARILDGVRKNKYLIIPGFRANALYYLQRIVPGGIYRFVNDCTVKTATRKSKR